MRPDDDDQIVSTREIVPKQADGFSQKPFYAIPSHGIANSARYAQAPATVSEIIRFAVKRERSARLLNRRRVYRREGDIAAHAVGTRKCVRFFVHFTRSIASRLLPGNRSKRRAR